VPCAHSLMRNLEGEVWIRLAPAISESNLLWACAGNRELDRLLRTAPDLSLDSER
jgi:hypothetical protein